MKELRDFGNARLGDGVARFKDSSAHLVELRYFGIAKFIHPPDRDWRFRELGDSLFT